MPVDPQTKTSTNKQRINMKTIILEPDQRLMIRLQKEKEQKKEDLRIEQFGYTSATMSTLNDLFHTLDTLRVKLEKRKAFQSHRSTFELENIINAKKLCLKLHSAIELVDDDLRDNNI